MVAVSIKKKKKKKGRYVGIVVRPTGVAAAGGGATSEAYGG